MDNIFWKILAAVMTATLPILCGFLCDLIHKLTKEAAESAKNERVRALVEEIDRAVTSAVAYVNQTFVDELKKSDVFGYDPKYAEEAFRTAYETSIETISADAMNWIQNTFGDVRKYLEVKIEESVKAQNRREN